jgi:hypothetical protein
MYAALWRVLPGGIPAKIVQVVVLASLVVTGLFIFVFPWVADTFLTEQSTLN